MADRMASDNVWDSLMKSFYDNKMQKLFFTLVGFQTYGYYPMQLIKYVKLLNFPEFFDEMLTSSSYNFQCYIYELSRQQHGAQIARFQKWYDIKEKDYELKSYHPMRFADLISTPIIFRTDPLLHHIFGNMVIFRSGNLYSLCSPGNQDYQKIRIGPIFFSFSLANEIISFGYQVINAEKLIIF